MQGWNRDPDNLRVIRVQDKGSRFVIDWTNRYKSKSLEYLTDETTFRETDGNPNQFISQKVERWIDRWKDEEVLADDECLRIKAHNPKPATLPDWRYGYSNRIFS